MTKRKNKMVQAMIESIAETSKKLGVHFEFDPCVELANYRNTRKLLTCAQLTAIADTKTPVWVVVMDDEGKCRCNGANYVEKTEDPKYFMLVDGTSFASDFEITEPDDVCQDEYSSIYGAVLKKQSKKTA